MPILLPLGSETTVAWIDWADRLMLELPECPAAIIADELRDAAIEFYRETRAWRVRNVTIATTVAGQAEYTVSVPSNTALAGLPAVWAGDTEIAEMTPIQEDDTEQDDNNDDSMRVIVSGDDTVRFSPSPATAGTVVTATVAYRPTLQSTGLASGKYLEHRQAIEASVFAKMMKQRGKAWSNPLDATAREREYERLSLLYSSRKGPRRRSRLRVTHAL
jgi:hypothetical protein